MAMGHGKARFSTAYFTTSEMRDNIFQVTCWPFVDDAWSMHFFLVKEG
jgi:hypothetical protein